MSGRRGFLSKSKSLARSPRICRVLGDERPRVWTAVGTSVDPLAAEKVVLDELEVRVEAQRLVVDEPGRA